MLWFNVGANFVLTMYIVHVYWANIFLEIIQGKAMVLEVCLDPFIHEKGNTEERKLPIYLSIG